MKFSFLDVITFLQQKQHIGTSKLLFTLKIDIHSPIYDIKSRGTESTRTKYYCGLSIIAAFNFFRNFHMSCHLTVIYIYNMKTDYTSFILPKNYIWESFCCVFLPELDYCKCT